MLKTMYILLKNVRQYVMPLPGKTAEVIMEIVNVKISGSLILGRPGRELVARV